MSVILRRDLLRSAVALTGMEPLCCVTPEISPQSVTFSDGRITIDQSLAPGLRRTGVAFAIIDQQRKVNLILVHADGRHYIALDRTCTHGGAMCTYNRKRHTLQCTSLNHAEYDLAGTLLHGRTHGNLRTYDVESRGRFLIISLGSKS